MRAVECAFPNCSHVHAADDDQLTDEVLRHAQEVHPEAGFTRDAARDFVAAGVYDDDQHA